MPNQATIAKKWRFLRANGKLRKRSQNTKRLLIKQALSKPCLSFRHAHGYGERDFPYLALSSQDNGAGAI